MHYQNCDVLVHSKTKVKIRKYVNMLKHILKDNFSIFQPGLYFSMCIRFIGTTRFKIGSVLREAGAAGSRKAIRGQIHLVKVCTLKVFFFRYSPAQVASVISVNNM